MQAVVPVAEAPWETVDAATTFAVDEAIADEEDCRRNPACGEASDNEKMAADAVRSLNEKSILLMMECYENTMFILR